MGNTLRKALIATLPVLTGYLVLGFGFGILMQASGFGILPTVAMSLLIYAGSMQFVAIGLISGGASLFTVALTTLLVNARHLFYGISMLEAYGSIGKTKPYLIFGLTDETYSLLCGELPAENKERYCFFVTLLDHIYWVTGSLLGAAAGALVSFRSEGIDFALTALFLTVFLEQWLQAKNHRPALVGPGVSLLCLMIFGSETFLLPAMLGITLLLCLQKEDSACE